MMATFAILGVILVGLFVAPLFSHDRPVARY